MNIVLAIINTAKALNDRRHDSFDRLIYIISQFRRSLQCATGLLLAINLAGLFLDFGLWTTNETLKGPFQLANSMSGLYAAEIGTRVPFWLSIRLVDDKTGRDAQNPQLTVDGRRVDLPATPRVEFARKVSITLGLKPRKLLFPLPEMCSTISGSNYRLPMPPGFTAHFARSLSGIDCCRPAAPIEADWDAANAARTRLVNRDPPWVGQFGATAELRYRSDIDGLRAIAVLSVLAYHYGFKVVSGGFVGVDIFFVISGFLITSLLFQEIEDGSFSLLRFYARRIRRIVPALVVMILITTMSATRF